MNSFISASTLFANGRSKRVTASSLLVLLAMFGGCGGGGDDGDGDTGLDSDKDGFTDVAENYLAFNPDSDTSSPCGGGGAKGATPFSIGAKSARIGIVDQVTGRLLHAYQAALPADARVGAAEGPPDVVACATHKTANDSSCVYVGGASCVYARPYRIASFKLYAAVDGKKLSEFSVAGVLRSCPLTITVVDGNCPSINFGGDVAPSAVMTRLQQAGYLVPR